MSRYTSGLLFLVVLLAGASRIAATYSVFSATVDENEHVEAGLEYWQLGRYVYEAQHPPLARAVLGAGPYFLADLRLGEQRKLIERPVTKPVTAPRQRFESFLWTGEWADPERRKETLSLARAGNLVFWILLAVVIYAWAFEALGVQAAWVAAAIAACSPTLLAHAGLATLDLAAAATATAAMYSLWRWTRSGRRLDLIVAAVALGTAVGSKLSLLVFLPPALVVLIWQARSERSDWVRSGAIYASVAVAALWAIYRFDFGPIGPGGGAYVSPELTAGAALPAALGVAFGGWSVPAPALFRGLIDVVAHNQGGHYSYLFDEWMRGGSWLYFPIALVVKTTLPFLALALWGASLLYRDDRRLLMSLLALPAAVLICAVPADINIGIRHVLPMYPCLAILAAAPFRNWAAESVTPKWIAAALLLWHGGESVRAHPDYLPYFNQLASVSERPILLDSNFDWGQDFNRLGEWIHENDVEAVIVNGFGDIPPDLPNRLLEPGHPDAGWFAISVNLLYGMDGLSPQLVELQSTEPQATVGRTFYLYRIDPRELPLLVPPRVLKRYTEPQESP